MNSHQNHFDVWSSLRKPISTILLRGRDLYRHVDRHYIRAIVGRHKLCTANSIALRHELYPDLVVRDPSLRFDRLFSVMAFHGLGFCHSHGIRSTCSGKYFYL